MLAWKSWVTMMGILGKASRTRRLYMAFCPKCGLRLTQTCVGNMRRPRFAVVEPRFEVKP